MGLDMYLYKKHYVKNWDHNPEKWEITVKKSGNPFPFVNTDKISYLQEEVAYWRKANAIHQWFVDNVQDGEDNCGNFYVDEEKLTALLKTIDEVLNDKSRASDILPTSEGFFFGGLEYDDYYFSQLVDTKKMLESELKLIKEAKAAGVYFDYYYRSSW